MAVDDAIGGGEEFEKNKKLAPGTCENIYNPKIH
jgi:hypothetical protein